MSDSVIYAKCGKAWFWCTSEDSSHYGPFATRDDAIKDGYEYDPDGGFLVTEGEWHEIHPADIFDIEDVLENWDDECENCPFEDAWDSYWGSGCDWAAINAAMSKALQDEIVRQGLQIPTSIEGSAYESIPGPLTQIQSQESSPKGTKGDES